MCFSVCRCPRPVFSPPNSCSRTPCLSRLRTPDQLFSHSTFHLSYPISLVIIAQPLKQLPAGPAQESVWKWDSYGVVDASRSPTYHLKSFATVEQEFNDRERMGIFHPRVVVRRPIHHNNTHIYICVVVVYTDHNPCTNRAREDCLSNNIILRSGNRRGSTTWSMMHFLDCNIIFTRYALF